MAPSVPRWRARSRSLTAIAIVAGLYLCVEPAKVSQAARESAAQRYGFTGMEVPSRAGAARTVRAVHRDYEHISAWISSVGAAVALADLDSDGLANDLCVVDVRTDAVVVQPVPDRQAYAPMVIEPAPLPYDAATTAPMGCVPADLNEDGHMDLLVYYWGRTPVLFLRDGERFVGVELVPNPARWFSNSASVADFDGDGHLDVLVANYFPDGARVLDATDATGQSMQYSMSRAYNGGDKHLLLRRLSAPPEPMRPLFEPQRALFDEQTRRAWTLAVASCDVDGDQLPELYFANDFGPDRMLHNRSRPGTPRFELLSGEPSWTTPGSKVLGDDSFKGMGIDFGDLDGDGYMDMVVSNIAHEYGLLESHFAFIHDGDDSALERGIAPYTEKSEELGLSRSSWAWDLKLGDFDNSGELELVQTIGFVRGEVNRWPELQELATGNDGLLARPRAWPRFQPGDDLSGQRHPSFFARVGSRYADLSSELGLLAPHVSRGVAIADVDGDGDLDLAIAGQWEPSVFYRNECPNCGDFVGIHARLLLSAAPHASPEVRPGHPDSARPSRDAIGAIAILHMPDGSRRVQQVDGGSGHAGKRSAELHFGLGAATAQPLTLELRYRDMSGRAQTAQLRVRSGWHTIYL
jgi:hypothetical protein